MMMMKEKSRLMDGERDQLLDRPTVIRLGSEKEFSMVYCNCKRGYLRILPGK